MDETSRIIDEYISASEQAKETLSNMTGVKIESSDIQTALNEALGIDPQNYWKLLDLRLSSEQIIEHLRSFNFKKLRPEILGEISLDESILPDGIERTLTEETIKVKGEIWRIHKNDADPFPSTPHAHNYESGVVLHLGTGEIFKTSNRKSLGLIGCKKLLRLRGELNSFELPKTECE